MNSNNIIDFKAILKYVFRWQMTSTDILDQTTTALLDRCTRMNIVMERIEKSMTKIFENMIFIPNLRKSAIILRLFDWFLLCMHVMTVVFISAFVR